MIKYIIFYILIINCLISISPFAQNYSFNMFYPSNKVYNPYASVNKPNSNFRNSFSYGKQQQTNQNTFESNNISITLDNVTPPSIENLSLTSKDTKTENEDFINIIKNSPGEDILDGIGYVFKNKKEKKGKSTSKKIKQNKNNNQHNKKDENEKNEIDENLLETKKILQKDIEETIEFLNNFGDLYK